MGTRSWVGVRCGLLVVCVGVVLGLGVGSAGADRGVRDGESFSDVPVDHPFFADIEWLVAEDIASGFEDGTFRPGEPVTRQALASFLYRYADPLPTPGIPGTPFSDVGPEHPFVGPIGWMAQAGLAEGFPDGTFRPTEPITRQALAAFLHRFAAEHITRDDPPVPSFSDVPADHPFFADIEWMAATGLGEGFPDGTYRPGVATTRQAMAAFLHRYDNKFGATVEASLAAGTLTVDVTGCLFGDLGDEPGFVTIIVFPAELGTWEEPEDIVAMTTAQSAAVDGSYQAIYPDIAPGTDLRIQTTCAATALSDPEPPNFAYQLVDVDNPGLPSLDASIADGWLSIEVTGCAFGGVGGTLVVDVSDDPLGSPDPYYSQRAWETVSDVPDSGEWSKAYPIATGPDVEVRVECKPEPIGTPGAFTYPVVLVDNPPGPRNLTASYVGDEVTVSVTECEFGGVGGYLTVVALMNTPGSWDWHRSLFAQPLPDSGEGTYTLKVGVHGGMPLLSFCSPNIPFDLFPGAGAFPYASIALVNSDQMANRQLIGSLADAVLTVDATGCYFRMPQSWDPTGLPRDYGGYLSLSVYYEGSGPADGEYIVDPTPYWPAPVEGDLSVQVPVVVEPGRDVVVDGYCIQSDCTGEHCYPDMFWYEPIVVDNPAPVEPSMTASIADGWLSIEVTGCAFDGVGGTLVVDAYDEPVDPDLTFPSFRVSDVVPDVPASGDWSQDYPIATGPDVEVSVECTPDASGAPQSFTYPVVLVENPPGPRNLTASYVGDEVTVSVTGCEFDGVGGYLTVISASNLPQPWEFYGMLEHQKVPDSGEGTYTFEVAVLDDVPLFSFCGANPDYYFPSRTSFVYATMSVENSDVMANRQLVGSIADGVLTVEASGCYFPWANPYDPPVDYGGYLSLSVYYEGSGPADGEYIVDRTPYSHAPPEGDLSVQLPVVLEAGRDVVVDGYCIQSDCTGEYCYPESFAYEPIVVDNPPPPPTMTATYTGDQLTISVTGCSFGSAGGYLGVYVMEPGGQAGNNLHQMGYVPGEPVPYPGDAELSFKVRVGEAAEVLAGCTSEPNMSGEWLNYPKVIVENSNMMANRTLTGSIVDGVATVEATGCYFQWYHWFDGWVDSGGYLSLSVYYEGSGPADGEYIVDPTPYWHAPVEGDLTVQLPVVLESGRDVVVDGYCISSDCTGEFCHPDGFFYEPIVVNNPL